MNPILPINKNLAHIELLATKSRNYTEKCNATDHGIAPKELTGHNSGRRCLVLNSSSSSTVFKRDVDGKYTMDGNSAIVKHILSFL